MKTEQPTLITSIAIGADLSKNLFIGFDGNLCSANAKALGVLNADTNSDEEAPVAVSGIALVNSGSAVTKGAPVKSDSNGKAIPAADLFAGWPLGSTPVVSDSPGPVFSFSGSVLGEAINGYALDAASAADELIRIKLV